MINSSRLKHLRGMNHKLTLMISLKIREKGADYKKRTDKPQNEKLNICAVNPFIYHSYVTNSIPFERIGY